MRKNSKCYILHWYYVDFFKKSFLIGIVHSYPSPVYHYPLLLTFSCFPLPIPNVFAPPPSCIPNSRVKFRLYWLKENLNIGFFVKRNTCDIKRYSFQVAELVLAEYSTGIAVLSGTVIHVLYIHILFLNQSWLTMKKIAAINRTSLNKTDTLFLKKILVYFRTVKVFVNARLKQVILLPDFSWSRYNGSSDKNNSQNFHNIFAFNSQCPRFYPRYAGWWQMGFLRMSNFFLWSIY